MTDIGSQDIDVLEETTTTSIGGGNRIDIVEETATVEVIDAGFQGPVGASAYDLAVAQGFVGTVDEWLYSLNGNPNVIILGPTDPLPTTVVTPTAVFRMREV